MADFYKNQKDYSNDLQSVTKAYELSGSDVYKKRMDELKGKE